MKVIKPPTPIPSDAGRWGHYTIFLAGSIEMGLARDWQARTEEELSEVSGIILNPRREAWDPSWTQSVDNPIFVEQVTWELDGQSKADTIIMYLDPGTKAPITLLELGLFATSGKLLVCCPEGYWRKGNVDVVCNRYGIPQVPTLVELIENVKRRAACWRSDL